MAGIGLHNATQKETETDEFGEFIVMQLFRPGAKKKNAPNTSECRIKSQSEKNQGYSRRALGSRKSSLGTCSYDHEIA